MQNLKRVLIVALLWMPLLSACGRPTESARTTPSPEPIAAAPIKDTSSTTDATGEMTMLTFKFDQDSDLSAFPTSGLAHMTSYLRKEALVIAMTGSGGALIPIVTRSGNKQSPNRVSAMITLPDSTAGGGVALYHVSGHGYVCSTSGADETFRCRLFADDQWQNLLTGHLPTEADPQEPLLLDLSESGGVFSLSINGKFSGSFRDEQYRGGSASIFAETAENTLSEVTFDDVTIYLPGSTTAPPVAAVNTAQPTRTLRPPTAAPAQPTRTPRPPTATSVPATTTPPPTRAEASTRIEASTLPLAEGNKWVYKKTVSQKVFAWEAYRVVGKDSVTFARGTPPDFPLGESEETFTVMGKVERDGLELWEIAVSSPTARDGRYGSWFTKPDQILWGGMYLNEQVVEVKEIMISESYFEGEKRHEGLLLLEPLVESMQVEVQSLKAVSYTASFKSANIEVPAGSFETCLEMVTHVKGSDDQEGWTTISYYAPGVGLVAEVQLDDQDQPTYTLELLRYELNSPSRPGKTSSQSPTATVRPTSTPTATPTRSKTLTGKLEVEGEVILADDTSPLGGIIGGEMYRVIVHLTNGSFDTLTFDLAKGFFAATTLVLESEIPGVDGTAMKLESGEDIYLEFNTGDHTAELLSNAGSDQLTFVFTLLYKESAVAGPYMTSLPAIDSLSETSGAPLSFYLATR